VLVHEVTSWDGRRDVAEMRAWGHTHVDEMAAVAEAFEGEALVLVHRSLRHRRSEARAIVQRRFPSTVRDRVHVFGH
jgi:ribonuclease Z